MRRSRVCWGRTLELFAERVQARPAPHRNAEQVAEERGIRPLAAVVCGNAGEVEERARIGG